MIFLSGALSPSIYSGYVFGFGGVTLIFSISCKIYHYFLVLLVNIFYLCFVNSNYMILRIRVHKENNAYKATNIFSITGSVDSERLSNLLARVQYWIDNPNHYAHLLAFGSYIPFKITDNGIKYDFQLMKQADDIVPIDVIESAVEQIAGMTVDEMITKTRNHEIYKPRVLLFASLRFFSRMSTKVLERRFGYDHASILHCTKKALPSFMAVSDDFLVYGVRKMAEDFNNSIFEDVCTNGRYPIRNGL